MLCANCGAEDGLRRPGERQSVSLSIAEWLPGRGLLLWCSRECHGAWHARRRVAALGATALRRAS